MKKKIKIFSEQLCLGGGVTSVQKVVYKNEYLSTGIQAILLLNRVTRISNLFAKHFILGLNNNGRCVIV